MKKVTAFVPCARKGHTHDAVVQFMSNLPSLGDVECEIVRLSDYRLQTCIGCKACFERGEEHCPLADDRDVLIEKMLASDGVVFASPNYSFQVAAAMKIFLERLAFAFHRPRFFGKTYTSIVVQGIYGGDKIVKYLDFAANALGFNTVKGSLIMTLDPMTDKQQRKMDKALAAQARRFHAQMQRPAYPTPGLVSLMFFRMGRTKIRLELDDSSCDYRYYAEKGWLDGDYYYPVELNALQKGFGRLFDALFARTTKAR